MTAEPLAWAAAGISRTSVSVNSSRRIKGSGLALRHADLGEGGGDAGRPGVRSVGGDVAYGVTRQPGAQCGVVAQPHERGGQRGRVLGVDDEAVALVAHEPAGGGADLCGGDDGESLVHGFVGDEAPRLAEGRRAPRRYDHNVRARQEVADLFGRRPGDDGQLDTGQTRGLAREIEALLGMLAPDEDGLKAGLPPR